MRIEIAPPPNYEAVCAAFPQARRGGVIFTYGDVIYNPSGVEISGALKAHESVHSERQRTEGVERWWGRYLTEGAFRLEEELVAHRAEWRAYCGWERDRNARARQLDAIAQRLASPLYGGVIGYGMARRMIVAEVQPTRVRKLLREAAEATA